MTLMFPNRSRSYDDVAHVVRFVGYDGMFEVRIGVQIDALAMGPQTTARTDVDYLAAFDAARGTIQEAARAVYAKHRTNMFVLTLADLPR